MAAVVARRMMAELDGDFVVFLVGMRVNRWWRVHKWWPIAMVMPKMVRELLAHPGLGCLHAELRFGISVQYWRSFSHLEAYARDHEHEHWPAWTAFNRKVRAASGDVGIWHETYQVRAREYETLYSAMPRIGLARAGRHVPIGPGMDAARDRLGRS